MEELPKAGRFFGTVVEGDTVIHQPCFQCSRICVDVLLSRISGGKLLFQMVKWRYRTSIAIHFALGNFLFHPGHWVFWSGITCLRLVPDNLIDPEILWGMPCVKATEHKRLQIVSKQLGGSAVQLCHYLFFLMVKTIICCFWYLFHISNKHN